MEKVGKQEQRKLSYRQDRRRTARSDRANSRLQAAQEAGECWNIDVSRRFYAH